MEAYKMNKNLLYTNIYSSRRQIKQHAISLIKFRWYWRICVFITAFSFLYFVIFESETISNEYFLYAIFFIFFIFLIELLLYLDLLRFKIFEIYPDKVVILIGHHKKEYPISKIEKIFIYRSKNKVFLKLRGLPKSFYIGKITIESYSSKNNLEKILLDNRFIYEIKF